MDNQRLIDANRLLEYWLGQEYEFAELAEIIDSIEDAPTVEPDGRKAEHWEFDSNGLYRCTGCGQAANKYQRLLWDYCPKCGAAMWEARDGEKAK